MTLRQTLEQDAPRIHEQVDAMLESEDSIIILVDARRAITYARGSGSRHVSSRCLRMT